jgi:hypothetical protein
MSGYLDNLYAQNNDSSIPSKKFVIDQNNLTQLNDGNGLTQFQWM